MCEFKDKNKKSESNNNDTISTATVESNTNAPSTGKPMTKSDSSYQPSGIVNFEIALSETKFGKFNYFLIIVAGFILGNVLLETLGVSFVLPVSECELHLTTEEKGIISAIGFAGIISSSHLWGFLADTKGRRRVILPTLMASFAFTVTSSFAKSFWVLVILRYLNGFFISGGSATIYAYLGEFHTGKTRSRAIMGASFIFGIGSMLMPIIAWIVINQDWSFYIPFLDLVYKPWRLFIIVCGLPGFICAICLLWFPESPKFLLSQDNQEETIKVLRKMYVCNTGKSVDNFKYTAVVEDTDLLNDTKAVITDAKGCRALLRSMWNQTAPLFGKNYLKKTILACSIQFGIFATSNGMYMWFPSILNGMVEFINQNPGNTTTICRVVHEQSLKTYSEESTECVTKLEASTFHHSIVLEIMYIVGFAIIGFIINAIGKIPILFVILVGCGSCGVAAVLVDIPMLAVYMYVILLACGLGVTVVNAATVDLYPTNLRAMAVCISLMMGRLGSVVGANIVGILLDRSCEAAFFASGISLILCGFLGFLIPMPPKDPKYPRSRRASLISMTGN